MRALSLSDYQLQQLRAAAKNLSPSQRTDFLEGIAKRLGDQPSDEALQHAIAAQLSLNRLPVYLWDSKPNK
jgi:hypothetical protein